MAVAVDGSAAGEDHSAGHSTEVLGIDGEGDLDGHRARGPVEDHGVEDDANADELIKLRRRMTSAAT